MAKSSKQSYETQWQKAFEDAEMQPSAQLWKNIESDLNATENAKFKRGLLFYRTLAAAAVACLVILGIYTWSDEFTQWMGSEQEMAVSEQQNATSNNNTSEVETEELPENTNDPESIDSSSKSIDTTAPLAENAEKSTANTSESAPIADNELHSPTEENTAASKGTAEGDRIPKQEAFTGSVAEKETISVKSTLKANESAAQRANGTFDEKELDEPERQSLIAAIPAQGIDHRGMADRNLNEPVDEIYPIPIMPKDKKNAFQPVFFAGLNLSTDYFNPNYDAQSGMAVAPNSLLVDDLRNAGNYVSYNKAPESVTDDINTGSLGEENTAQLSFSYGVNFGMALSEHWIIESGLTYSKYNTSTQTSATFQGIAADEAYPVSLANNNVESIQQFSSVRYEQTQLTNTFDFVAVPMKIGYNLSFDRISVVFSTGVAANFLLQNNISDDAGRLNEITIRPDESSPFRKVYYSGILSGGVHYHLMKRYSFSITPSYNFPLSSLTKSESNFMSLPYLFGIDFGIRYQF